MPSLKEELLELEARLLDPELRRRPEALADLIEDGFVEFGGSGRAYDRRQVLEAMRAAPACATYLEDFQVRELAPGCALATYRAVAKGSRSLRSSIWLRRGGAWKVAFHQGTPLPAVRPAPGDGPG